MKTINFERKRKTLENERYPMIIGKINSMKMISLLTVIYWFWSWKKDKPENKYLYKNVKKNNEVCTYVRSAFICILLHVYLCVVMWVEVCVTLNAHTQGGQKTISGGVPWERPTFLLLKTGSLTAGNSPNRLSCLPRNPRDLPASISPASRQGHFNLFSINSFVIEHQIRQQGQNVWSPGVPGEWTKL